MSMEAQLKTLQNQDDRDFIVENIVRFYRENSEEERTNSYEEIREYVRDLLNGSDNEHKYFLITADNTRAGIIQIMKKREGAAELILIYLLPNYRRKGLGRQALKTVIKKLKDQGVEKIKTEVNITNDTSQSFFADLGFKKHSLIYTYKTN